MYYRRNRIIELLLFVYQLNSWENRITAIPALATNAAAAAHTIFFLLYCFHYLLGYSHGLLQLILLWLLRRFLVLYDFWGYECFQISFTNYALTNIERRLTIEYRRVNLNKRLSRLQCYFLVLYFRLSDFGKYDLLFLLKLNSN